MPFRRILPIAFLVALLCAPAADAASRYRVGIGDQHGTMFSNPSFQRLGLKKVRYLVPWDWRRVAGQRAEVEGYMAVSRAAGKDVFVTFTATRGCWTGRYSRARRCRAPSARAYRRSFKAFRRAFPYVKTYAPWNEANHVSQPTARSPKLAARYWNVVRRSCRGCRIVALDILDQSNAVRYLRGFRRHAKGSPRRWGLHNYSDVNRKRSKGTRAILRAAPGEVWLTETGGVVSFGRDFPWSPRRAAARTRYMFKLAGTYSRKRRGMRSRITRIYPYSWTGTGRHARFDAGLTNADGTPRPAYFTFRSLVRTRSK